MRHFELKRIAPLALLAIASAASADGGVVRGRVTYRGPAPARPKLTVDVNTEVCGAHGDVLGEQLLVGDDAGLAHAVVVVTGDQPRGRPGRARLDQRGCVFQPHVQSVTMGATLVIGNDDPVVHNVHGRVDGQTVFNLGMPLQGVSIKRRLTVPGVTRLTCDSGHHWMQAYVVVVPHALHATSDARGAFAIADVPAGAQVLRVWHERLGTLDVPVDVRAGEAVDVVIELPAGREAEVDALSFERPRATAAAARVTEPPPLAPGEGETPKPSEAAPPPGEDEPPAEGAPATPTTRFVSGDELARGRASYGRHCAACHGEGGDGRGEAAPFLRTRPRRLDRGEIAYRSTPSGAPALEEDLIRTITVGLPGTDMPAWGGVLPLSERRALARYVMSLSPRFAAPPVAPLPIPEETPADAASIARGRVLWDRFHCAQCHGPGGRADGVSRRMVDDWGEPITPADLTRGVYEGGPSGRDLYRTLITGLSGTPMPAFADLMGPSETWDLVHYVQSLAEPPGLLERWFGDR